MNKHNFYFLITLNLLGHTSIEAVSIDTTTKKYALGTPKESIQDFSKTEYEHYMGLIKKIDPTEYDRLRSFEHALKSHGQKPLLHASGANQAVLFYATEKTHGYPRLAFPSLLPWDEEFQKKYLSACLDTYKTYQAGTISLQHRKIILDILHSLAPELYAELIAVDPTGENHIISYAHPYAAITPSLEDGLPIIFIGNKEMQLPYNQLCWCMAHELGHYALGHFGRHTITHNILDCAISTPPNSNTFLSFKEALHKAWQRTQEYEADRFSIMNLGASIDDAIEYMGGHRPSTPKKYKAFQAIHPLPHQFIDHMESLRKEVELQQARKLPLPKIDWKALIKKYKQPNHSTFYKALETP